MVIHESNDTAAGRENLLAAIRDAVAKTGRGAISMKKFLAVSGIKSRRIFKHFRSWSDALSAAGVQSSPGHARIDPTHLMEDCARVARLLGHMPSRREYSAHGKFDEGTLARLCGGWGRVADALRAFVLPRKNWADLLPYLPADATERRAMRRKRRHSGGSPPPGPPDHGPSAIPCGPPLDFGPMRHEPTNEQGVVFLFGKMAEPLGFIIEGFQTSAFPDCQAKRHTVDPASRAPGRWRNVRIEFEYESRNFRSHAHDPAGCDLIVCWIHNWPDCPVEVLPLSEEIKRLRPGKQ